MAEAWEGETERPIIQGYGLTETSPIITANPLVGSTFNDSVGVPLPSTEIAFVTMTASLWTTGRSVRFARVGHRS